jgi:hypothetical protein
LEGVHVRLGVANANPEMDVRHVVLRLARGSRAGDRVAFDNLLASFDAKRPEVRERRLVLPDSKGHGETVPRHLAGESDLSGCGRADGALARDRDVDAAVLTAGVLVAADRELP